MIHSQKNYSDLFHGVQEVQLVCQGKMVIMRVLFLKACPKSVREISFWFMKIDVLVLR